MFRISCPAWVQPVSISLDFLSYISKQLVRTLSIPEKLRTLLDLVVAEGASDLHLSALLKPRWRVDGRINEISNTLHQLSTRSRDLLRPITQRLPWLSLTNTTTVTLRSPSMNTPVFGSLFRDDHGGAVEIASRIYCWSLGLPPM